MIDDSSMGNFYRKNYQLPIIPWKNELEEDWRNVDGERVGHAWRTGCVLTLEDRVNRTTHPFLTSLSLSLSLFLSRQQRPFSSLHPREYWIPILRCPLRQRTLAVWTFIREFGRNQSEGEVKGRGLPSLERERETKESVAGYVGFYARIKARIECRLVQMHTGCSSLRGYFTWNPATKFL